MEVTINNLESYLTKTYGGFAEKNGVSLAENNLFMKLVEEIGEVANAEIEDLDRLTFPKLIGKAKIGHIRTSARAIYRKETQSR